jgi:hypothetical protein
MQHNGAQHTAVIAMNLHQFRFVQEAARRNLNLTEAAKALHSDLKNRLCHTSSSSRRHISYA